MKNIVAASIIAFASLFVSAHMAANAVNAREGWNAPTMQAQQSEKVWLVSATISDNDGNSLTDGPLYFRQSDPERRFATEAACVAFLNSGDEAFAAANDGLTRQIAGLFGDAATVKFSCTVEPMK